MTVTSWLLLLPPVVWSKEGPVSGDGVGPLCLVQSMLLDASWTHSQRSTSNVQLKLQAVGKAGYGAERKAEFLK